MRKDNTLIYIGTIFLAFGRSFSDANFPSYVETLGGNLFDYGVIQSVQMITNLLFLVPTAILADKLGYKRLILSSTLILTISFFIIAFSSHWEYLLISAVGIGLGEGIIIPSQVAILAHENPNDRIAVFTKNETSRWGGLALGYFFSSFFFFIVHNKFSYINLQFTMIFTLFFSFLAVIPFLLLEKTEEWRINAKIHNKFNIANLFKNSNSKFIFVFLAISLVIGFGAGFLIPFSQPYFVKRFSFGPSEINFIMGMSQIITALLMGFVPFLSNRITSTRVIYLTQGLSVPLTLILAFSHVSFLSVPAYLFRMAFMNMSSPARTEVLQENVSGSFRATIQSLMQANDRLGRGFSTSMSAYLIEKTNDFLVSFVIAANFYFLAVLLFFIITRKKRNN